MRLCIRICRGFSTSKSTNINEWNESKVIIDRRSKFQARHVTLNDSAEIPTIMDQFLAQHKSIAKNASHPHMLAWRTGEAVPRSSKSAASEDYVNIQQGFKDCGEKGAGSRILDVLVAEGAMNKLVIVSRWFGGAHIGSSRFRHIANCSAESLRNGATKK